MRTANLPMVHAYQWTILNTSVWIPVQQALQGYLKSVTSTICNIVNFKGDTMNITIRKVFYYDR